MRHLRSTKEESYKKKLNWIKFTTNIRILERKPLGKNRKNVRWGESMQGKNKTLLKLTLRGRKEKLVRKV